MKILLINYATIGQDSATGQTLKNLFSFMPGVELLQYSLNPYAQKTEDKKLEMSIRTVRNTSPHFLTRLIYRYSSQKDVDNRSSLKKPKGGRLMRMVKNCLLLLNEVFPIRIGKKELAEMDSYAPQVIYTLGADINVLRNVLFISKRYDIPVVLHNMDDLYHTKFPGKTPVHFWMKKRLQKLYREVYKHSVQSLAIGPLMAAEYKDLFNLSFDWAMNCAANDAQSFCVQEQEDLMIFSGGMHGGRSESLLLFAQKLENERTRYRLEIYTSSQDYKKYGVLFSQFRKTAIFPFVPKEKHFANLTRAKILLHIESFEPKFVKYFRLSMSTKIPEYIAIGKPILCIGNDKIATVAYVKQARIGVCFSSVDAFFSSGLSVFEDEGACSAMRNQATELSLSVFSPSVMRKKLLDCLGKNVQYYNSSKEEKQICTK